MCRSGSGPQSGPKTAAPNPPSWMYLCFHLFLLQLDEGHPRKVHGVCGETWGVLAECTPCRGPSCAKAKPDGHLGVFVRPGRDLGIFFSPSPFLAKTSPFSSICSCPDLVEATTLAAISLTLREHSWSRARFLLLFSAFTCKEHGGGYGSLPRHHHTGARWLEGSPRQPYSALEQRHRAHHVRMVLRRENLGAERTDGQMDTFILDDPITVRQGDPCCKALQPQDTKPALLPPELSTRG